MLASTDQEQGPARRRLESGTNQAARPDGSDERDADGRRRWRPGCGHLPESPAADHIRRPAGPWDHGSDGSVHRGSRRERAHTGNCFGGCHRRQVVIPQTILSLIAFLFLVAPGILFELLQERRRPARTETAFREAGRTALASLLFSLAAILLLAIVDRWRVPGLVPDVARWLTDPPGYLRTAGSVVIRFVLLELTVAVTLAVLADRALAGRRQATVQPSVSGWWQVFRRELPREARPYARVQLTDGSEYCGTIVLHTLESVPGERELVLGPPLTWKPPAASKPSPLDASWQRVCIPGTAIQVLWVAYVPEVAAREFLEGRRPSVPAAEDASADQAEIGPVPGSAPTAS